MTHALTLPPAHPGATSPADGLTFNASGGFFAYHGVWAPGVRLFRKLDFKAKAAFISLAFMAPIAMIFLGLERDTLLAFSAASVALAVYLFICFYKVVMGGLKEVQLHLEAMTQGDLTTSPSPWGKDEIASLMKNISAMQDSLTQVVAQVRNASDTIVHSSREISADTLDLSSRTEQAVSNLEETNKAMGQISATVSHTADSASQVATIATENAAVAAEGGRIIAEVETTMHNINEASRKISDIIGVIDSIAFQTNILALNAAVEAARAGEQGRGFAVVASEVRALAQRSADAAREIKTLITTNVEQVACGTRIVHGAGDAISALVDKARTINDLMTEVASGTQQQSQDIGRVGMAVAGLDQSTQLNAAVVSASAAAAESLKEAAFMLSDKVKLFKLADHLVTSAAPQEDKQIIPDSFDFDAAIEAHRAWKMKLRKAISHHEKLDIDTISRDDCCALGKWIHGPGGKRYASKARFVELQHKHRDFHQAVGTIARSINSGQHDKAERLLGAGSSFTTLSTDVVSALNRFKQGK